MGEESDANVLRRAFEEMWSEGNLDLVDELYDADFIGHVEPNDVRGWDGIRESVTRFRTAFPDLRFTVEESIANGDTSVVRWTAQATHEGTLELLGRTPATGRKVSLSGLTMGRLSNGKISEAWSRWNQMSMLRQIGALESPDAS